MRMAISMCCQRSKAAKNKRKLHFVLQQLGYDQNGIVEPGSVNSLFLRRRPTTINGQLVPDPCSPAGCNAGVSYTLAHGKPWRSTATHCIEVRRNGISLGQECAMAGAAYCRSWPVESKLVLSPGGQMFSSRLSRHRRTNRRIFLRDLGLSNAMSSSRLKLRNLRALQSQQPGLFSMPLIDITDTDKPEQVLAEIIIEGPPRSWISRPKVRSRTLACGP